MVQIIGIKISLEGINQPEEPTQEQPQQPPISFDLVQRKRKNNIFKCENCGTTMSKKTLLYAHNCLEKPTQAEKEQTVPLPVVKEVIREVIKESEVTDSHIEEYINRKNQTQEDKAKQERHTRFAKLMPNAF